MGKFDPRELCAPGSWVLQRNAVEFSFQVLVGSFCLPITLLVEAHRQTHRSFQLLTEKFPDLRDEFGVTVRNNV